MTAPRMLGIVAILLVSVALVPVLRWIGLDLSGVTLALFVAFFIGGIVLMARPAK